MLRRKFIRSTVIGGAGLAWQGVLPAWAKTAVMDLPSLTGSDFDLRISALNALVAGKQARHIRVNDQFPAPLLRWKEGDEVVLRIQNELDEPTSIHWHGLLLPYQMDGVPGVSFPGIAAGDTFTYRFPLKQSGTYWYHSHSGFQEQIGHYGPIVIDPLEPESFSYDREYVVMLSDWSFEKPERIFSRLKKMSGSYNYQNRTVKDFFNDVKAQGLNATLAERMMWGNMRMSPTDLADVTAATYTYMVNGHSPAENWTGLFKPGERIRLRFINASAMSIFNVRIPGLPMMVVAADGQSVEPVETDEFQIGTAETFDVVVQPDSEQAYTIMAETNDFFGYARATLATQPGMQASVPPLRKRPLLGMQDMGMSHAGHDMSQQESAGAQQQPVESQEPMNHAEMNQPEMNPPEMNHAGMNHAEMNQTEKNQPEMNQAGMNHAEMNQTEKNQPEMNQAGMNHAGMNHTATNSNAMPTEAADPHVPGQAMQRHDHKRGPGVDNVAENPVSRLHERPLGLEKEPHRVLIYSELRSLLPNTAQRSPERELELHLTGSMDRYMWSFDGLKYSEIKGPVPFRLDERVRIHFVNDTMMPHPIHLHGMFFEVVNGQGLNQPHKHTLVIKPGEKVSIDLTADAEGYWAFHCHLLYHMHAGMMRVFSVSREQV